MQVALYLPKCVLSQNRTLGMYVMAKVTQTAGIEDVQRRMSRIHVMQYVDQVRALAGCCFLDGWVGGWVSGWG